MWIVDFTLLSQITMTKNQGALNEKRQQALQRLQKNRGKQRFSPTQTRQVGLESTQLLVKGYPTEEQLAQSIPTSDEPDTAYSLARKQVSHQEQEAWEASQRLQEFLRSKPLQQQDTSSLPINKNLQLLHDALSTNFFEQTTQWLASSAAEPDFSSTPVEEIEEIHQQVKYRHKVLNVMLEATQKELDHLQLHIKNLKSYQQQKVN